MNLQEPRCILFSHLQAPPSECQSQTDKFESCPSYTKIIDYRKYLSSALERERTLLLLFYDAAWVDFMNVVGADFDFERFAKSSYVAWQMSAKFQSENSTDSWIRVITAKELSSFVNNLRGDRPGDEALRWRRFFVSDRKQMLYDCSKVVEAIVRLRHIGSGIPVLRIDEDVLYTLMEQEKQKEPQTTENLAKGAAWLGGMLARAKRNHHHCIESSDVYSFVFSGGYWDEGEKDTREPNGFIEWATAYSTRVYPALFARTELLMHNKRNELLTDFARTVEDSNAFDDQIAREFYGFHSDSEPAGIIKFGAHPKKAVISGSLFCMSDGAILDLPPASNFQSNVIWIDDHLKYALLKDLGQIGQKPIKVPLLDEQEASATTTSHFADSPDKEGKTRILTARIPHCYLPKGRQMISNFGFYVLGVYLPSLMRGMVMDRWVCFNPTEKSNPDPNKNMGALTSALRLALARGRFEERDRESLRVKLKAHALQRIEEIWDAWRNLGWQSSIGKTHTFASMWVSGEAFGYARRLGARIQDQQGEEPPEDWIGWGLLTNSGDFKTFPFDELAPAVKQDLEDLIDDAITYIDWALQWPHFVQAVRILEPRAAGLDLREEWGR